MSQYEELRAIAAFLKVPLYQVVLLNLMYETTTSCTSIIVEGEDGRPLHGRTLDWPLIDLHDMTINVDFQRGGRVLFSATTFAGFVGTFTAIRKGAFSISVNFREDQEGGLFLRSHLPCARDRWSCWPVGFLVRHILEDEAITTFVSARSRLESCLLVRSAFFTLAGCQSREGALITRSPQGRALPTWDLAQHGTIVQVGEI